MFPTRDIFTNSMDFNPDQFLSENTKNPDNGLSWPKNRYKTAYKVSDNKSDSILWSFAKISKLRLKGKLQTANQNRQLLPKLSKP